MANAMVLACNLDIFALGRLKDACAKCGATARIVKPEEYAMPIGALAGIPVRGASQGGAADGFSDPMLVMCGMLSDQLDAFLAALRVAGLRVPLKAVLTPSNVSWSLAALHEELAREHEEIARRKER